MLPTTLLTTARDAVQILRSPNRRNTHEASSTLARCRACNASVCAMRRWRPGLRLRCSNNGAARARWGTAGTRRSGRARWRRVRRRRLRRGVLMIGLGKLAVTMAFLLCTASPCERKATWTTSRGGLLGEGVRRRGRGRTNVKNWIAVLAIWMIAFPSAANINPDGRTTTTTTTTTRSDGKWETKTIETTMSDLDAAKVVVEIARALIDFVPLSGEERHATLGCEDMISWFFTSRNCAGGIYTRGSWVMMVTGEDHNNRPELQAERFLPGGREQYRFTRFGEPCAVVYAASPNADEYPLYIGTGQFASTARDAAGKLCRAKNRKCRELLWGCNGWERMGIPPFRPAYDETIQFIRLDGQRYEKCGGEPGRRCRKR